MMSPWLSSLLGGFVVAAAALGVLLTTGRIAGISGYTADLLSRDADADTRGDAAAFLGGLLVAGGAFAWLVPARFGSAPLLLGTLGRFPTLVSIAAGMLVGAGARLAGGCTSGHGVCGIGRLSPRSMVAIVLFIVAGAATLLVVRHGSV